jgi:hypothetical protein
MLQSMHEALAERCFVKYRHVLTPQCEARHNCSHAGLCEVVPQSTPFLEKGAQQWRSFVHGVTRHPTCALALRLGEFFPSTIDLVIQNDALDRLYHPQRRAGHCPRRARSIPTIASSPPSQSQAIRFLS